MSLSTSYFFIELRKGDMENLEAMDARLDALDDEYDFAESEVPDEAYDQLLAKRNALALAQGLPVRGKRKTVHDSLTVPHRYFMGSIENVIAFEPHHHREGMINWVMGMLTKLFESGLTEVRMSLQGTLKYDGVAISIERNRSGEPEYALTRGTMTHGENHLSTLMRAPHIKAKLEDPRLRQYDVLRGELILTYGDLDAINLERTARGEPPLKKLRNAVAGILKSGNSHVSLLRWMPYHGYDESGQLDLIAPTLWPLEEATQTFKSSDSVETRVIKIKQMIAKPLVAGRQLDNREYSEFDYDGIVISVTDPDYRARLGYVSDCPVWALALKPKPKEILTTIREVAVSISRIGTVTPVLKFDPVDVDGVRVSSINGDNYPLAQALGTGVGAVITVGRNGDVIPRIQTVVSPAPIEEPTHCPCCQTKLTGFGAKLTCPNIDCVGRVASWFAHIGARDVLDIDNMGEVVGNAYAQVTDIQSLFTIDPTVVCDSYRRINGRSSDKDILGVFEALHERTFPMDRVILALSVPALGHKLSRKLALTVTWSELLAKTDDEILSLINQISPGIGTAVRIRMGLVSYGLHVLRMWAPFISVSDLERPLTTYQGHCVCLSGSMSPYAKPALKAALEHIGVRVSDGVSAKLTYLVAGSGSGAKSASATKLGIPIIDVAELIRLYNLKL